MIFAYKEDLLQFIWENQLYDQQELYTEKRRKSNGCKTRVPEPKTADLILKMQK